MMTCQESVNIISTFFGKNVRSLQLFVIELHQTNIIEYNRDCNA